MPHPSNNEPISSPSRWPLPYKAAVSFTMDNLGEAQDVLNNTWSQPIGTHPAVTTTLPRILSLLAKHNIRATYFAEAWSLGVYLDAVRELQEGGHEVAWHGWQHERWGILDGNKERELFGRSWDAAKKAGVRYFGFRPPGGKANEPTWKLLDEYGAKYISPEGRAEETGIGKEGIVVLPFEWKTVDAWWYMEKFASKRKEVGENEEVKTAREFEEWLMKRLDEVKRDGGFLSVLFHPFLQASEEKLEVLEAVAKRISGDPEIWVAPCKEIADWVREHPELYRDR